jgi:hypothetical protein
MLFALIEAPLASLLAAALGRQGPPNVAAELAFIEDHAGQWMFANFLWIFASVLWIIAATGVYVLVQDRRPRLGAIAWVSMLVGSVFQAAIIAYAMVQAAMVESGLARTDVQSFATSTLFAHPAFLWLLVPVVFFYIGLILMAIALWRARAASQWMPVGVIGALSVGVLMRSPLATEASFALLLLAFGTVAMRLLRQSRPEKEGALAPVG